MAIQYKRSAHLSDEESSVAAGFVVAESATLQKHDPDVGVSVATYEETSLCEVVAERRFIGVHPGHLLSRRMGLR